jgi:hypothetical protein
MRRCRDNAGYPGNARIRFVTAGGIGHRTLRCADSPAVPPAGQASKELTGPMKSSFPRSTPFAMVVDLEELLGTRLLIRTTRKLTLAVPKRSMTNRYRIPRFSAFSPD